MRWSRRVALLCAANLLAAAHPAARADDWRPGAGHLRPGDSPPAEGRIIPYDGVLPPCDAPDVLKEIAASFSARESDYWSPPFAGGHLEILGFVDIGETSYRGNGPSYIPRRYCGARADFNDGLRRRVVYQISESWGFIGMDHGVVWCVVGLDRHRAYGPACKAAGP